MIAVLAGGVGAARLLAGLVEVISPTEITAIVNVGDDLVLHGLAISPDLDTVTYTLAGQINTETGWGLEGESWRVMDELSAYGGQTWFRLGDRDLATHLYRTQRLGEGTPLSEVTAEITSRWQIGIRLLPATDDELRTRLTVDGHGEIDFQTYFVGLHHDVVASGIRFAGAGEARPAPGVIEAIEQAETIVIAPSNPLVSIGPVLAVPGIREAVTRRRSDVVAISPIIDGRALKGPADRLMTELGHDASVLGVARMYAELASTLVIDEADAAHADAVEQIGMTPHICPTIMSDPIKAAALAQVVVGPPPTRGEQPAGRR